MGSSRAVHYNVHGVNAQADFTISECQTCAILLVDTITNTPFLGMYGGMLRADPGLISDLIFSTGQMSDFWLDPDGRQGARAHLPDRLHSHFEVAGGKRCAVTRRNGVPGLDGGVLHPLDPRWVSLERVWISEDAIYVPPASETSEVIVTSNFTVCISPHISPSVPVLRLGFENLQDSAIPPELHAATEAYLHTSDIMMEYRYWILCVRYAYGMFAIYLVTNILGFKYQIPVSLYLCINKS